MKEKIIDIYENNKGIVISLIKRENKYIVEKCFVKNNIIGLFCSYNYTYIKDAKNKYNELKAE